MIMPELKGSSDVEIQALVVIVVLMLIGYLWVRHNLYKRRQRLVKHNACKELILNKRHALASVGADIDGLVSLVRMGITPEQLETVIDLLTAPKVEYNIDNIEDPKAMEVNLDFDKADVTRKKDRDEKAGGETGDSLTGDDMASFDQEDEQAWFRVAHNQFIRAVKKKDVSDRRDQVKLLAAMVELGCKAVEDDPNKPIARKVYERELWDRFYEKEYLNIHA
jgi:hypothetical protein